MEEDKQIKELTIFSMIWAIVGIIIYFTALAPMVMENGIIMPAKTLTERNIVMFGFLVWCVYLILGVRYSYPLMNFFKKLFKIK